MHISEQIWDKKYRLKDFQGNPIDQTVEDTWRRVAKALAEPEEDRVFWEAKFFDALKDYKFLPAGRITAGAGTDRNVTLFNCYVMGTIPDSMNGIFTMLKEAALTMQQGGGIGYDFSTIRPKGSEVKGVAADASGPLSFMDCWDAMCRTVMSAGSRRGAMMGTMRCDHPDIFDFIKAKQDAAKLRMFNLSVLITDPFMDAVKADAPWDLVFGDRVYRTIRAVELWDAIMQATYDYAEPGVIFIDRINQQNNLHYIETIAATNPCGEQPLPPYGACLLGSINLAALVKDPFTEYVSFDVKALDALVGTAVRMMDNVIEVSNFPLEAQRQEAHDKRRIGLGVTGLADALVMWGYTYGSDAAVGFTDNLMSLITLSAYRASVELAKEKGAFPLFAEEFNESQFVTRLPRILRDEISDFGIRNALLTSIAPTGTISLYAGNVSSGIEPIFAHSYTRKVLQKDGSKVEEEVVDYAVAKWRQLHGDKPLPDYFVTAQDLPPEAHVKMQAVAQKWIDSSISKTVNLPADISFEDFKSVYALAYETGCKGCTTYRPNDITGSVLSVEPAKPVEPAPAEEPQQLELPLEPRPEALRGVTYKLKWPQDAHAIYITINDDGSRPLEVFFNTKNVEHQAWMVALARTISAVFRRGGPVEFLATELKEIADPKGGAWVAGKYVPSLIAAIGNVILGHIGRLGQGAAVADEASPAVQPAEPAAAVGAQCPSCGEFGMKKEAGCDTCPSCGYSKCG